MARPSIMSLALALVLLTGCGGGSARMERPENPQGRFREQIAAAQRVLEQKESWADRVEWEVVTAGDGWEITAWRVEHPDRQGANRYLPWGCSIIRLDRRLTAVGYHRKG